jgi:hypothetical protein
MSKGTRYKLMLLLMTVISISNSGLAHSASYSVYPSGIINGFINGEAEFSIGEKSSLAGVFATSAWDPMMDKHLKHRITTMGLLLRSYPKGINKGSAFAGAGITYFAGNAWNLGETGDTTGYIFNMKGFYTRLVFGTRWFINKFFISPSIEISQPLGNGNIGGKRKEYGDMTYKTTTLNISIDLRIGISPNKKNERESTEE